MHRIKSLYLFIILLGGCTKPLDLPLQDEVEDLAVISCFFTPHKMEVYLNSFHPILQNESLPIETAHLELWHNDTIIAPLTHLNSGVYRYSGAPLSPGLDYEVTISYNDQVISATDQLPLKKIIPKTAAYSYIEKENGDEYLDINFSFEDSPNTANYYEFLVLNTYYDAQKDSTSISYVADLAVPDAVIDREGDLFFSPASYVFSDAIIDGQDYDMNLRFEFSSISSDIWVPGKYKNNASTYYLIFRSISENYYNFRKSWFKHRSNQSTDNQFNNEIQLLFGGEPSPLFSNTSNDVGIFAGYHEIIIPIEEF